MLYSIKNREDLENLNDIIWLQNRAKAVILKDKLGEQFFHQEFKKEFEPATDTIENTSEHLTKTMMLSSKENNKELDNLSNKILETLNGRGIIASYLMSFLSNITDAEKTSQIKLVNYSNSDRVIDLLVQNTIPVTVYDNLLTFRDTVKMFDLKGDLSKMITNKNYNVNLDSLLDENLWYDSANETYVDIKAVGIKSTRDRILIKLLKSPIIMVSA